MTTLIGMEMQVVVAVMVATGAFAAWAAVWMLRVVGSEMMLQSRIARTLGREPTRAEFDAYSLANFQMPDARRR